MTVRSLMRILIIDAFPGKALQNEIQTLMKQQIAVTLNVNRFHNISLSSYGNDQAVQYVDFNCEHYKTLFQHIIEARCGFDILQSRANIPFNRDIIKLAADSKLKHPLKIIAQAGVGVNHIDCDAATECGVIVTNTPGSNANAVAEFIMTQILTLAKNTTFHNQEGHCGIWSKGKPGLNYWELRGKTLGIIGIGHVAKELIPKAHAFGMHILGLSNYTFSYQDAQDLGIEKSKNIGDLLSQSDFVSLCVPLNTKTRNLIGYKELRMMKKGAFLINTSRGGIVDEAALAKELQSPERNLAGAAIDTVEREKSSYHTPLIGLNNVLLTPHIAGSSQEALELSTTMISQNIQAILRGDFNVPIVNKNVLDKFKRK